MAKYSFTGIVKETQERIEGDLIHNYDGRMFIAEIIIDDYVGTACDKYVVNGHALYEVEPDSIDLIVT